MQNAPSKKCRVQERKACGVWRRGDKFGCTGRSCQPLRDSFSRSRGQLLPDDEGHGPVGQLLHQVPGLYPRHARHITTVD